MIKLLQVFWQNLIKLSFNLIQVPFNFIKVMFDLIKVIFNLIHVFYYVKITNNYKFPIQWSEFIKTYGVNH